MSLDPQREGVNLHEAQMSIINHSLSDRRIQTCHRYQRMARGSLDLGGGRAPSKKQALIDGDVKRLYDSLSSARILQKKWRKTQRNPNLRQAGEP